MNDIGAGNISKQMQAPSTPKKLPCISLQQNNKILQREGCRLFMAKEAVL